MNFASMLPKEHKYCPPTQLLKANRHTSKTGTRKAPLTHVAFGRLKHKSKALALTMGRAMTTSQIKNLIARMRENKRAARAART